MQRTLLATATLVLATALALPMANAVVSECTDLEDNDSDTGIDITDPGCHTDEDGDNVFSYDALHNNEGSDDNVVCGVTVTGPSGTTLSCTGHCLAASGTVIASARWLGGPGNIRTTVTGCGVAPNSSATAAPGSTSPAASSFGTNVIGIFTCTVEVVGGVTPTAGSGTCTWS